MSETEKPKRTRKKAAPKPEVVETVVETQTVIEPVQVVETPPAVEVVETVTEPIQIIEFDEENQRTYDASEILERRLGVGHYIAYRLATRLTADEQVEIVRAHNDEDHESYNKIVSALRFRKTPKS